MAGMAAAEMAVVAREGVEVKAGLGASAAAGRVALVAREGGQKQHQLKPSYQIQQEEPRSRLRCLQQRLEVRRVLDSTFLKPQVSRKRVKHLLLEGDQ